MRQSTLFLLLAVLLCLSQSGLTAKSTVKTPQNHNGPSNQKPTNNSLKVPVDTNTSNNGVPSIQPSTAPVGNPRASRTPETNSVTAKPTTNKPAITTPIVSVTIEKVDSPTVTVKVRLRRFWNWLTSPFLSPETPKTQTTTTPSNNPPPGAGKPNNEKPKEKPKYEKNLTTDVYCTNQCPEGYTVGETLCFRLDNEEHKDCPSDTNLGKNEIKNNNGTLLGMLCICTPNGTVGCKQYICESNKEFCGESFKTTGTCCCDPTTPAPVTTIPTTTTTAAAPSTTTTKATITTVKPKTIPTTTQKPTTTTKRIRIVATTTKTSTTTTPTTTPTSTAATTSTSTKTTKAPAKLPAEIVESTAEADLETRETTEGIVIGSTAAVVKDKDEGGSGIWILVLLIGLLLVIGSAAGFEWYRRRRKQKKNKKIDKKEKKEKKNKKKKEDVEIEKPKEKKNSKEDKKKKKAVKVMKIKKVEAAPINKEEFKFKGPLKMSSGTHGSQRHAMDDKSDHSLKDPVEFDVELNEIVHIGTDIEVVEPSVSVSSKHGGTDKTTEGTKSDKKSKIKEGK